MNDTDIKKGATLGMWLFLFSEIMLFGGLFIVYANYYYTYTDNFVEGASELSLSFGAINTVILLISSFFVAAAIFCMHENQKKKALILLSISIFLGLAFLTNKYFEWSMKFDADIFPGSDRLTNGPQGALVFFGLYFTLTGLHALHVIVGLTLLAICFVLIVKGKITAGSSVLFHNSGLYWHLVDIIWIFLFPLLYLIL